MLYYITTHTTVLCKILKPILIFIHFAFKKSDFQVLFFSNSSSGFLKSFRLFPSRHWLLFYSFSFQSLIIFRDFVVLFFLFVWLSHRNWIESQYQQVLWNDEYNMKFLVQIAFSKYRHGQERGTTLSICWHL